MSLTPKSRKNRNELDLNTKLQVLNLVKQGKSLRKIAENFSCSTGQILNIAKKRRELEIAQE